MPWRQLCLHCRVFYVDEQEVSNGYKGRGAGGCGGGGRIKALVAADGDGGDRCDGARRGQPGRALGRGPACPQADGGMGGGSRLRGRDRWHRKPLHSPPRQAGGRVARGDGEPPRQPAARRQVRRCLRRHRRLRGAGGHRPRRDRARAAHRPRRLDQRGGRALSAGRHGLCGVRRRARAGGPARPRGHPRDNARRRAGRDSRVHPGAAAAPLRPPLCSLRRGAYRAGAAAGEHPARPSGP